MSDCPKLQKVCGLDVEILEEVLCIIRDYYHVATKANYFLENKAGISGTNVGITNLRDVLSHLSTMLNKPEMSRSDMTKQIGGIEEHLRRAIVESYSVAVSEKVISVARTIKYYQYFVLPWSAILHPSPNWHEIKARMLEVEVNRNAGRDNKAHNKLDAEFLEKLKPFHEAFRELDELQEKLIPHIMTFGAATVASAGLLVGIIALVLYLI